MIFSPTPTALTEMEISGENRNSRHRLLSGALCFLAILAIGTH